MSAPLPLSYRIPAIDVLRGVAILGILLLNIGSFAMPNAAYVDPYAYGDMHGANGVVYTLTYIFAFGKFITIFGMLFGAGLIVQAGRGSTAGTHYRRMLALLVIGALHAYLLWYGDILFSYALLGMLAFLLRNLSPRALLWTAAGLYVGGLILNLLIGVGMLFAPPEMRDSISPDAGEIAEEVAAFRGGWIEQMPVRLLLAIAAQTFLFIIYSLPFVGGMICVGMALAKLGFFAAAWRGRTYAILAIVGCSLGWSLAGLSLWFDHLKAHDPVWMLFIWMHFNTIAMPLVAVGYSAAIIGSVSRLGRSLRVLKPFEAVGCTALSCYLLTSILCTTFFYGHGFGYFGYLDRVQQLYVVFGVWSVLLVVAPLWLMFFRQGPMEWLWRRVTYGRAMRP